MIKNTRFTKKILDYKYVTDLSNYKKTDVILKNRQVFDEHYILISLSQTRWSAEHMKTIILLRFNTLASGCFWGFSR